MEKDPFSVTTKVTRDSPEEMYSEAFEAWSVCFCGDHPAITESEILPKNAHSKSTLLPSGTNR